jgi:hypothetical protein
MGNTLQNKNASRVRTLRVIRIRVLTLNLIIPKRRKKEEI